MSKDDDHMDRVNAVNDENSRFIVRKVADKVVGSYYQILTESFAN